MTNQQAFKCKGCRYRMEGKDKRFPYCTHKGAKAHAIPMLLSCPKKR
jgi:hypothetical protein